MAHRRAPNRARRRRGCVPIAPRRQTRAPNIGYVVSDARRRISHEQHTTHRPRGPVLARRTPARCAPCCATGRFRSGGCCATPKWDDLPLRRCRSSRSSRTPTRRATATATSPSIRHRRSCGSKREHADRSVVPSDPALAFIDMLIEDFGDEWVTKMMYHYRWAYDPDIAKAGKLLPLEPRLSNSTRTRHSNTLTSSLSARSAGVRSWGRPTGTRR